VEELLILLEQAAGLCQDMNDGYLAPWQPLKQAGIGLDTKSTFELGLGYKARCELLQDPKRAEYLAPWQPLKQAGIGLDTKSTFELGLGYKARCKLLQDPKRAGYLAPWQPGIGLDTKKSTFELEPGYSWALDFELVYSW
jgi:hypothetical protein